MSLIDLEGLLTGLGPNQDLRKDTEEDWGPDGVVDTPEEAATSLSDFLHVLYPFVLYVALALEDAMFALFVPCIRDLLPPAWAFNNKIDVLRGGIFLPLLGSFFMFPKIPLRRNDVKMKLGVRVDLDLEHLPSPV